MIRYINVIFALFFFVLCGVFGYLVTELPKDDLGQEIVGMGFFPIFCIAMICALSALMAIINLIYPFRSQDLPKPVSKKGKLRISAVLLLMLIYSLAYETIGFYIGTYIFAVLFLIFIGEKKPLVITLCPAVLIAFVYFVFVEILGVVLPEGEILYYLMG